MTTPDETLRYPIGRFDRLKPISPAETEQHLTTLATFPQHLTELVVPLTTAQLDSPYRPGGWTLRQVVHHLADSHLNAYIRLKWALTEDNPTIKAYREAAWAELPDGKTADIALSLPLLSAVHTRWVTVGRALTAAEFDRTWYHPDRDLAFTVRQLFAQYDWHSRHHYAHIAYYLGRPFLA